MRIEMWDRDGSILFAAVVVPLCDAPPKVLTHPLPDGTVARFDLVDHEGMEWAIYQGPRLVKA